MFVAVWYIVKERRVCNIDERTTQAIYNMVDSSVSPGDEADTPDKRTKEIFDKMDSNGDGVLSKDEFIQGCMADEFLCQMLTADPGPE